MEFSRQEYWSGLPFPSPRDLPHPRIKPMSLMSPALAGKFFTTSTTWEALLLRRKKVKLLSRVWLFVTPWGLQPTRLLRNFPGKSTRVGYHFLLQGPSRSRIEPGSPALQADALPSEPPGRSINSFQKDFVLDDLSMIESPNLELIEKKFWN